MDAFHNYLTSDHFPLLMCIQIGANDECPTGLVDDELIKFLKIKWDQLKPDVLSNYRQTTDSLLGDIELPDDIVDCSGVNCDKHSHINCLSELYVRIMHCLSKADKACIPERQKRPVSPVPGWNDYLAEPYKKSREAYFLWCSYNKPRSGVVRELVKSPEQGSNMLKIKYWGMKKLYVQMHWHQSLLVVISNVSGKRKSQEIQLRNVANSYRIENETGSQNIYQYLAWSL